MDWRDRIGVPDKTALTRVCSAHHVVGLWLFGSVLRGDFRPNSDIDILVEFDAEATVGLIELARLQGELSLMFGRSVDLVPVGGLKPMLRDQVLADRELLYAA